MKKIFLAFLILVFLSFPCWATNEDFTSGWTESDPNSQISATATRITWTGLVMNSSTRFTRDALVDLSGDFDMLLELYCDSSSGSGEIPPAIGITNGDGHYTYIGWGEVGSKVYVQLNSDDVNVQNDNAALSEDTLYYARFKKISGTLYLDFYASSTNRTAESSKILSLSVASAYSFSSGNQVKVPWGADWGQTTAHTGYLQNLDLAYSPSTPSTTYRRIMIYE